MIASLMETEFTQLCQNISVAGACEFEMEKYKKFVACVPQAGTRATTANPTLRLTPYVGLLRWRAFSTRGAGNEKIIIEQCFDNKKSVFLPLEINRGTVRFRRPQFGDDPRRANLSISFFYFCIAVMQYWMISPVRLMPTIIFTVPTPAKL